MNESLHIPRDYAEEYSVMEFFSRMWERSRTVIACGLLCAWMAGIYLLLFTKPYTAEALIRLDASPASKGDAVSISSEIDFIRSRSTFMMALEAMGPSVDIVTAESPLKNVLRDWFGKPTARTFAAAHAGLRIEKFRVPDGLLNQPLTLKIEINHHYTLFDADGQLIYSDVLPPESQEVVLAGRPAQPIELTVRDIRAPAGSTFTLIARAPKSSIAALQRQLKATAVSRSDNARFMRLTFASENSNFSKRFLAALVDTYVKRAYDYSSLSKLRALDHLGAQLKLVKAKLETAESNLKDFQQRSNTMDMTAEMQFALQQVMDLETQIRTVKSKQRELSAYYTPAHPSQLALSEQLQFLQSELSAKQAFIEQLPETQRQLLQFAREVETYKQMYQLTSEKFTEMSNEAASIVGYATVVDAPEIMPGSGLTFFVKNVIAGFVLGCVIGAMMVYIVYFSPFASVRSAVQVKPLSSLPILGCVMRVPTRWRLWTGRKQKRVMPLIFAGHIDPKLFRHFFVLLKNLGFATFNAPNPVVMITAQQSGHASAVIAANIAAMYAKLNKTLLIDGSMLERGIHRYLQVPAEPGLSDVMIGKAQADDAVRNLDKNLYFLPGGTSTSYGPQLLTQGLFIEMLKEFSKTFRHIILYYPNLREEQMDSALVDYVGSIALVVSDGQKVERVRRFLSLFQNRTNAKGIILDDVSQH